MQTSYSLKQPAVAHEGQLADNGMTDKITMLAEGAVPFGKLVVRGTDADKQCKVPAVTGDISDAKKVLGIALHDHAREQDSSAAADYSDKAAVAILRQGRCYVKVEEAVTVASDVYVRHAAGGNGVGSFGDTAGAGPDRTLLAGAKYLTDAGANEFALVEVKL